MSTAVTAPRPEATGREFVALITASMALSALAIDTVLPAFGEIRAEFAMPTDSTRVSMLLTAFFIGMALGPWLYGPASDRFGRRTPLFAGLALYAVAGVAAAVAPNWQTMVIARFVWGLGAAGPRTLAVAMVRDRTSGDEMARLMSMVMAVFLLVPIFAPGIGALLMLMLPWRTVFWFPAVVALALAVWARRLPETLPADRRRPFTWRAVALAGREVTRHGSVMAYTLAIAFVFATMTTYLTMSELIIDDVYDRREWFPVFFGVIAVFFALSSLNNARLVQRIGLVRLIRRMSGFGVLIAGILVIVSIAGDGRPPLVLFTVLLMIGLPAAQGLAPNCNAAAMTPLPHVAGTASSLITTITTAGGAVLGGMASARYDGSVTAFAEAMLVFMLIAMAMVYLGSRARPTPPIQADRAGADAFAGGSGTSSA